MLRTMRTKFYTSKDTITKLFELNKTSALVWNDCLKFAKEHYLKTGQWINKSELQQLTKKRFPLHSQSIQAVAHKYLFARENTKKAQGKGYSTIRYPYKEKKYYNTKWANNGFLIQGNQIFLKQGTKNHHLQEPLVVKVKALPQGVLKEIELIYDRGLMLCLYYEDGIKAPGAKTQGELGAIDLGEIHAITAVSTKNEGIIITGRKLLSIHRLRNKKLKELQKKMAKCTKGSKQWRKYNRAKQYVLSKSEAQLKDALHKVTYNFVQWAVEQQFKEVVVGEVEGVQRHTSSKKKKNAKKKRRSRNIAQKLSQWLFGKTYEYLEYKLKVHGINLKKRSEAYSSQTCPVCGRRHKTSSRNFKCQCYFTMHRDVLGGSNILSLELYGDFRYLGDINTKYLRVA